MKKNTFALKGPKGVTLIELSVVIAVILVLISVLFIGANYYRTSANRSACVINQSAISKAAESYMNIENLTTVTTTTIFSSSGPFQGSAPECPVTRTSTVYSFTSTPANGQLPKTSADPDGVTCSTTGHIN